MKVKNKFKEKDLVSFPLNQSYCPGVVKYVQSRAARVQSLRTGRMYLIRISELSFIDLTIKYLI